MKKSCLTLIAATACAFGSMTFATQNVEAATVYTPTGNSTTFDFFNIYPINQTSESSGDSYVGGFKLKVEQYSSSKVLLRFINNSTDPSMFVGSVYIDDNTSLLTLLNPTADQVFYNTGTNVQFANVSTGGTLPQGNKVGFSSDFTTTRLTGSGNAKAIQSGESLGILFGGSYSSVVSAFSNNTIAAGLHLQGIGTQGYSDAFSTSRPVPLPPLALGLLAAAGFGGLRLSRRTQKVAK